MCVRVGVRACVLAPYSACSVLMLVCERERERERERGAGGGGGWGERAACITLCVCGDVVVVLHPVEAMRIVRARVQLWLACCFAPNQFSLRQLPDLLHLLFLALFLALALALLLLLVLRLQSHRLLRQASFGSS